MDAIAIIDSFVKKNAFQVDLQACVQLLISELKKSEKHQDRSEDAERIKCLNEASKIISRIGKVLEDIKIGFSIPSMEIKQNGNTQS